ncbi:MAG: phosphoribosylglycinamide formyltransferase [Bacteroidota bacterium]
MRKIPAVNIAIFASGGGSNARKILAHQSQQDSYQTSLLITNSPKSGVFQIGHDFGIPAMKLSPTQYRDGAFLTSLLAHFKVDVIVLAGYLKLIPADLVKAFPKRILNIHPSLLPKYGGKGMYGMKVHENVILYREKASGITIHYVNEIYDEGEVILQKEVEIAPQWTAIELQKEVQKLEHRFYPEIVEKVCLGVQNEGNK